MKNQDICIRKIPRLMKKILFAVLLCSFPALYAQDYEGYTTKELNLQSEVTFIRQQKYVAQTRNGNLSEGARIGNLEEISFSKELKKVKREVFTDANTKYETDTYKYNEAGLIKEEIIIEEEREFRIEYKYNRRNNLLTKSTFNQKGELEEKVNYTYNKKGQRIKKRYYDSVGENEGIEEISYDEDGRMLEIKQYWNGAFDWKQVFEYKKESTKPFYRKEYDNEGKLDKKVTISYDDLGRVIKESIYFPVSKSRDVNTMKYNERGDQVIFKIKRKRKTVVNQKFKYEYDDKGNWIKKIEYEKHIPKYVTVRKVFYDGDTIEPRAPKKEEDQLANGSNDSLAKSEM